MINYKVSVKYLGLRYYIAHNKLLTNKASNAKLYPNRVMAYKVAVQASDLFQVDFEVTEHLNN